VTLRPRPPRRTLRRQARVQPERQFRAELLLRLDRDQAPATVRAVDLAALFSAVWRSGRAGCWSTADARRAGWLPPGADPRRVGRALADLVQCGGNLGPWRIERVSADAREGVLWGLRRLW
jgi:hypothetical protein